jgi:hypothetical protein
LRAGGIGDGRSSISHAVRSFPLDETGLSGKSGEAAMHSCTHCL